MKLAFADWSRALGEVESGNDPIVKSLGTEQGLLLGDSGQALGTWQQHPSFTQQWAGKIVWGVSWTWEQMFEQALAAFYRAAVAAGVDDVTAAVGFHLHGQVHATEADIAGPGAEYAARFRKAAGL